jgi:hypothetical protein
MLKLLFLLSIMITIALTALQLYGAQVTDLILIMLVINFLSMGAYIELENKKIMNESKAFMASKLESIEKLSNSIFNHVSCNSAIEEKLEKQKNDISYVLDKISKKSLELEERLNLFAKVLSNNIVEKGEDEKEAEQTSQSYNVGEVVYIEDDENKSVDN